MLNIRVGIGYDAHQLVAGRPLVLGGVTIPHDTGLLGHSDADVVTHVLIDALLGAANMGSIGTWFPNTEAKYAGVSSVDLLSVVVDALHARDFRIGNIDMTVVAQAPKLMPYVPQMAGVLGQRAQIDPARVSIKATTTEGLGFEGEKRGISAHCVVLIYTP
jgi:2-C-methyl-D-erythritol 2,4-cyclodiphosphate synthase